MKNLRRHTRTAGLTFLLWMLSGASIGMSPVPALAQSWTSTNGKSLVEEAAPPAVHAFALSDVRLLEGPFLDAMQRDAKYMFSLDPDRLLYGFFTESGLEPTVDEGYGGWESDGLGGHTLGHYLSAMSMYFAASGDETALVRVNHIVAELARIQRERGDGYASATPGGVKLWEQISQGDIRASGFYLNGVWSPWYTMHKVFAGLLDAYWNADNREALVVAQRMADWAIDMTSGLDEAQWQEMLITEYGGMNEALANLYGVTGDVRYLELSREFHDNKVLHPLAERIPDLTGLHSNTQIPKIIGVARQYELIGDDSLKTVADFFWEQMVDEHTYVIGGNSQGEYLGEPGELAGRTNATTAETCNTYNMLRLTRSLFTQDPRVRYADYYERALYNHILASQDPDEGMFTYYMSLRPGGFKTYSTPEGAFWCCVGSGMENHVKYGEAIYFHGDDALYVNLFVASELTWSEKGIGVRQDTTFPDEPVTRLTVSMDSPRTFAMHVRHPSWADGPLGVTVNGEGVSATGKPGTWLTLTREWRDGDVVKVTFPMHLRTEAMPDDPSKIAILYGPIVLGGTLGTEGLPTGGAYADEDTQFIEYPAVDVPVLVADPLRVKDWVRPVAGDPLTFHTVGVGRPEDVILKPFYRIHHELYSIYWDTFDDAGWTRVQQAYEAERERERRINEATVDAMRLGEIVSEEAHGFEDDNSVSGIAFGRKFREARSGGWFSFEVKTAPEGDTNLLCTYWGGDTGRRTFDILVDGKRMATESLDGSGGEMFFDQVYTVPLALTRGKGRVRVRFQPHDGNSAGRVFGCKSLGPVDL